MPNNTQAVLGRNPKRLLNIKIKVNTTHSSLLLIVLYYDLRTQKGEFNNYILLLDNRGFMTANGQPDNARAARYVLKDFMNGRLLYCHAPPNVEQDMYHTWPEKQKTGLENRVLPPREARAIRVSNDQKKIAVNLF